MTDVMKAIQLLNTNVFTALCAEEKEGLVFCSPLSVALAVGMLLPAATGQTLSELQQVYGVKQTDTSTLTASFKEVFQLLHSSKDSVKMLTGMSAWVRGDVKQQYQQDVATAFQAEVAPLSSPAEINGWVEKKTKGLIKSIIDEISDDTVALLINTIYFKGLWKEPFEKRNTVDRLFTSITGKKQTVPTMFKNGEMDYGASEKFQIVSLPYGAAADRRWDTEFALAVVLPKEGSSTAELLAEMKNKGGDGFRWFLDCVGRESEGSLWLPKLDLEYGVKKLNDCLQAIGLPSMFVGGLDNVTDTNPFVSQVLHKAVCKLDEEGTVAAAVTAVEMCDECMMMPAEPWTMDVNRPFLMFIYNAKARVPLFCGHVTEVPTFRG
eukprot:TRINITY_DN67352_c10_g3_i3.p1 TRINITY_DN67352_c10_g3~~TRINITY_DN67352_c10_g3_i3.p1  ORF type:complete len:401 (+),score=53.74 TRINITY_DN67352_c10_g3_i3:69-1205(+)